MALALRLSLLTREDTSALAHGQAGEFRIGLCVAQTLLLCLSKITGVRRVLVSYGKSEWVADNVILRSLDRLVLAVHGVVVSLLELVIEPSCRVVEGRRERAELSYRRGA
ncbi:MAG: hypothetical protein QM784_01995 [Polyangiaceae bacterium]